MSIKSKTDWVKFDEDYIVNCLSNQDMQEKYGMGKSYYFKILGERNLKKKKQLFKDSASQVFLEKNVDSIAKSNEKKYKKLDKLFDLYSDKVIKLLEISNTHDEILSTIKLIGGIGGLSQLITDSKVLLGEATQVHEHKVTMNALPDNWKDLPANELEEIVARAEEEVNNGGD